LGYVVTARAKAKIKNALKEEKKKKSEEGREILERKFVHSKLDFTVQNINNFANYLRLASAQELFVRVALGMIDLKTVKAYLRDKEKKPKKSPKENPQPSLEQMVTNVRGKSDMLILGENLQKIDYKLSPCCTPIPGDDVFGFITINEGIKIHRVNCPNALQLMSNYAYRIVKAKWMSQELLSFLAGIQVTGIDEMGIVNNITKVISNELNVNMRSIGFDTDAGTFEGTIMVFVHDTKHLTDLMNKLRKVPGVLTVKRIDSKN
jgi:guanosine-3',5'-bis(diphosphate) 3'-pyrophosphohydrolase